MFFAGFVWSVLYEWLFSGMTSAYARLPVLFGVLFCVSMFISRRVGTSPVTRFLSKYSLGIFALHPYWMVAVMMLLYVLNGQKGNLAVVEPLAGIVTFILTIVLTCLSAYGLGKTRLRVYVS